jgi:UDP-N-acetylmuramyl pentapeptide phosphotransferase/UDP-N-acetylglucosamine-1-phosphate transferase
MTALLATLAIAFVVSAAAAHGLATSNSRFWPRDEPNARSLHTQPTPRTGGLAILLGLAAGLAAFRLLAGNPLIPPGNAMLWILGGVALVAITSVFDDFSDLPPALRLVLQTLAAAGVVWGASLAVASISIPEVGPVHLGWLASVAPFLGLLWMTNLYNFMDGLDGFAGGMTAIGGVFLGVAFLRGDDGSDAQLAFILAAASAGFLLANFPPARIFMGDSGAVTIGFLFGIVILRGAASGAVDPVVALIVFAPFVVDATVTLLLRLGRRDRVWKAHRSHFYQRLVLAGWSHRRTVLLEYGLMVVCGVAGLAYASAGDARRIAILASLSAFFAAGIAGVRRVQARA